MPIDPPPDNAHHAADAEVGTRNLIRAATRGAGRGGIGGAPPGDEGEGDLWLISYADMMTLLFAVFVIVVSIVGMTPQDKGGDRIMSPAAPSAAATLALPPAPAPIVLGLSETAGLLAPRIAHGIPGQVLQPEADIGDEAPAAGGDALADLRAEAAAAPDAATAARYLASIGLGDLGALVVRNERIGIAIDMRALFDLRSWSATRDVEVDGDGRRILARLYPLLSTQRDIVVETAGASWEWSAMRGGAVARVLSEYGIAPQAMALSVRRETEARKDALPSPLVLSWRSQ